MINSKTQPISIAIHRSEIVDVQINRNRTGLPLPAHHSTQHFVPLFSALSPPHTLRGALPEIQKCQRLKNWKLGKYQGFEEDGKKNQKTMTAALLFRHRRPKLPHRHFAVKASPYTFRFFVFSFIIIMALRFPPNYGNAIFESIFSFGYFSIFHI